MFEHFLTDLLKIVIVLDVLGVVAYFLLGVLKPKSGVEPANPALSELASPPVPLGGLAAAEAGKFGQLRSRLATAVSKLLPGRGESRAPASAASLEAAFVRLNRVLHSYGEGLT